MRCILARLMALRCLILSALVAVVSVLASSNQLLNGRVGQSLNVQKSVFLVLQYVCAGLPHRSRAMRCPEIDGSGIASTAAIRADFAARQNIKKALEIATFPI
jgi:hypothetical protein